MGVIKSGILGGFSGKVGAVVGTSWKGIDVMKKLPAKVANPQTTPQTNQRNRFKGVVEFASAINSSVIKPLWDRFAQRKSGNNAFVQRNIDNFNTSGVLSAPSTLEISNGKMTATPITVAVADISLQQVVIDWSSVLTDNFQNATDIAYAVAYNATTGEIKAQTSLNDRSTESTNVAMDITTGDVVHSWLAFRRADGTVVSDTAYLLATVIA
jgi:hypothetical protein